MTWPVENLLTRVKNVVHRPRGYSQAAASYDATRAAACWPHVTVFPVTIAVSFAVNEGAMLKPLWLRWRGEMPNGNI